MKVFLTQLFDLLLPRLCLLCHAITRNDFNFCSDCYQELPWQQHYCLGCAMPLATHETLFSCGHCLKESFYFDECHSLLRYDYPIPYCISQLKFQKQFIYAAAFGKLMAQKIAAYYDLNKKPDIIIAVPLHHKRYQERGFNQALEIAKPIAKQLTIPLGSDLCLRPKATPPQSQLSRKARLSNIKDAFVLRKNILPKHILLIDDVITTGATVNELSKILKQAGVKQIDIWACARATVDYP